jgi:hypothetical protein
MNFPTMLLRYADLVMEAVAMMMVAELVSGGQVAVCSTATSSGFLHEPNIIKKVFFLAFTEFASSTALHLVMADLNSNISLKK